MLSAKRKIMMKRASFKDTAEYFKKKLHPERVVCSSVGVKIYIRMLREYELVARRSNVYKNLFALPDKAVYKGKAIPITGHGSP
jgi:hypothetical protein